jgi:hypothetical protein
MSLSSATSLGPVFPSSRSGLLYVYRDTLQELAEDKKVSQQDGRSNLPTRERWKLRCIHYIVRNMPQFTVNLYLFAKK